MKLLGSPLYSFVRKTLIFATEKGFMTMTMTMTMTMSMTRALAKVCAEDTNFWRVRALQCRAK